MGTIPLVTRYATLAFESFAVVGPAFVRAVEDPETGENYLAFEITLNSSVQDVLTSLKRFRAALVTNLPIDDLYHVRLSYNLV